MIKTLILIIIILNINKILITFNKVTCVYTIAFDTYTHTCDLKAKTNTRVMCSLLGSIFPRRSYSIVLIT